MPMALDIPTLAAQVGALLGGANKTLSVAESCTGGLLGAAITAIPGSSAYFLGGIIAYHNSVKEKILGVQRALLDAHGSVSHDVAIAMAKGASHATGSDCSIAITGIAGPGGGSREKPAGLVYIAVLTPEASDVFEYRFAGDRREIREQAVAESLGKLGEFLGE
jgi:nicotinamide-nucleotide amidase